MGAAWILGSKEVEIFDGSATAASLIELCLFTPAFTRLQFAYPSLIQNSGRQEIAVHHALDCALTDRQLIRVVHTDVMDRLTIFDERRGHSINQFHLAGCQIEALTILAQYGAIFLVRMLCAIDKLAQDTPGALRAAVADIWGTCQLWTYFLQEVQADCVAMGAGSAFTRTVWLVVTEALATAIPPANTPVLNPSKGTAVFFFSVLPNLSSNG